MINISHFPLPNHHVGVKRSGSFLALLGYLDSWDTGELVVSDVEEAVSFSASDVSGNMSVSSVGHGMISGELLLGVIGLVVPCKS